MRITNKSMNINLLRHLNQGLNRYDRLHEQLVSGRRVLLPSDNPATIANIMGLKTSLIETDQYLQGVSDAHSWLDSTDSALDSLTNILHRLRDIVGAGATDSNEETSRFALAKEAEQIFDNVLQLANSTHSGRFIFAGQMTNIKPFQRLSDDPNTDEYFSVEYKGGYIAEDGTDYSSMEVEVAGNAVITINTASAREVDGVVEENLFTPILNLIKEVRDSLLSGDTESLREDSMGHLEQVLDVTLRERAELGAKTNRVELSEERLLDLKLNFNKLLKDVQGVDYAETIMHLKAEEHIYRTALSVGARILQPSLVDFLR